MSAIPRPFTILPSSRPGDGTFYGLNGQTIVGNSSGDWLVTTGTGSTQNAKFTSTHLLLGGLTTDGTGVLQFATHTTSAGGITLGVGTNIFTTDTATIQLNFGGQSGGTLTRTSGSGGLKITGLTDGGTNQSLTLASPDNIYLNPTTSVLVAGTKTLKFGATAAITLGAVADTTAGDFLLTTAATGTFTLNNPGTNIVQNFQEGGVTKANFQTSSGTAFISTTTAANLEFRYNSTSVLRLTSTSNAQIIGTKTLSFGATAAATIGVSADTTAGDLTYTSTSTGFHLFSGNGIRVTDGNGTTPGYAFGSQTNMGMYKSNTNVLAFATQGALMVTFQGGAAFQMIGGAGNMTITAGTGNSRTLTLQTTTSGGTATDSLVLGADQSVTAKTYLITTPNVLTYASPTSIDVTLASCYTVTTVNATGSVTFNATAGGTSGQEMTILITNDATSAKTITFGTNFVSTGTLTASAASRRTSISFKSNGTAWIETGRAVCTT